MFLNVLFRISLVISAYMCVIFLPDIPLIPLIAT